MAMLLRIPNPESRIPVIQKIPHSVPQSLAAGFEMRLRPPFGPRHVAARAGAVAQPGRGVEHVPHLFGVVLPVGGQVQAAVSGEFLHEQRGERGRSEEHTSELQSLMRISYAVFCLKKKNTSKKDKI